MSSHGYQSTNPAAQNYVDIGVNWGYAASQMAGGTDAFTIAAMAAFALLILCTGYLIIYNVFQISVAKDIRFYGLLKTIGTTPKQLRRIVRRQALTLALLGTPPGLALGWLAGALLAPVFAAPTDSGTVAVSANPLIFIAAAAFALFTVLVSSHKASRMAGSVSPIEAAHYTEGGVTPGGKNKKRHGKKASVAAMAWANLGRSRSKTVVTVLYLSLAVVLLTITVTLAAGFDVDHYTKRMAGDFQLANTEYFDGRFREASQALPRSAIDAVAAQGGVTEGTAVYGSVLPAYEYVTEDYYRTNNAQLRLEPEAMDARIKNAERDENGLLANYINLYGMEPFALDKLNVFEGDLSKLREPNSKYIAAVYTADDFDNFVPDSQWAEVGDTITLRYVDKLEYYDPLTGEIYPENTNFMNIPAEAYDSRVTKYHDCTYTVAAIVSVPSDMSYQSYGTDEFVLNDQTFVQDSGTDAVMYYTFDVAEGTDDSMDAFLKDYTENVNPDLDYSSKADYQAMFAGIKSMFLILGGALSFVVGLVGVLNFFNAILTGITVRQREFAMLQSIGMTGRQLKQMLILEGVLYAVSAIALALAFALLLGPLVGNALEKLFFFFTYKPTLLPVAFMAPIFVILGIALPLASYRSVAKHTIVERLRME